MENILNIVDSSCMRNEIAKPIQMNIYQSNTYRKDLSWAHFNYEPRV